LASTPGAVVVVIVLAVSRCETHIIIGMVVFALVADKNEITIGPFRVDVLYVAKSKKLIISLQIAFAPLAVRKCINGMKLVER
jgi:hypothetical protein